MEERNRGKAEGGTRGGGRGGSRSRLKQFILVVEGISRGVGVEKDRQFNLGSVQSPSSGTELRRELLPPFGPLGSLSSPD